MTKKYRVAWQYRDGRDFGYGPPTSRFVAQQWIEQAKVACPEILHWIEEVPTDEISKK